MYGGVGLIVVFDGVWVGVGFCLLGVGGLCLGCGGSIRVVGLDCYGWG